VNVGVLIITHDNIGQVILDTTIKIIGSCPIQVRTISIEMDCNNSEKLSDIKTIVDELDTEDGLLLLTDLYGATPNNLAASLSNTNNIIVAGLNLPMLIRVMNYHNLPLLELSEKAIGGGKDGVLAYYSDNNNKYAAIKN